MHNFYNQIMNSKYNTGMKISQNIKSEFKDKEFKLSVSHKQNSHERQGHWLQNTAQPVNREKKGGEKEKRIGSPLHSKCSMATNSLCKVQSAKERYRPNRMDEKVREEKQPGLQLPLLHQQIFLATNRLNLQSHLNSVFVSTSFWEKHLAL